MSTTGGINTKTSCANVENLTNNDLQKYIHKLYFMTVRNVI